MLEAIQLYTTSVLTVDDIAAKFDCSKGTIQRWVRQIGVKKRNDNAQERIAAILDEYKKGTPIAEIAKTFGVAQSFVSQQASKAGVQRRTFKRRA